MDERERRVGLNEAMFRRVNDRIEDLNRVFAEITQTMDIVCECGDADCVERIVLPATEYEHVRSDPTLFILVPGHEDEAAVETVVRRGDGYLIVQKQGEARVRLAAETDPRA